MSDNLKIYNNVRKVPQEAQKEIKGGRLAGKTDINPMWRLKTLTEQFGPVGFGWNYIIKEKRLETGANGEIAAFVDIELYVRDGEQWSAPIPGTGGSMFVAKEKNGMYTSDECFKMALTDAISVACKALGVGADVYWDKDATKYDQSAQRTAEGNNQTTKGNSSSNTGNAVKCSKEQIAEIFKLANEKKADIPDFDIFKHLEQMESEHRISTKYPYADKAKTKINWTTADYQAIKEDLELPF